MTEKLCIEWAVNGGRGYTSPYDDTPEVRQSLERHVAELRRAWKDGVFTVTTYPRARTSYMPGPVAEIRRELAKQ